LGAPVGGGRNRELTGCSSDFNGRMRSYDEPDRDGKETGRRMSMEPAICIEMFYPGKSAEEKLPAIAGHGFRNVEFWGFVDKDLAAYEKAAASAGIRTVNFSGHRAGDLVDTGSHPVVFAEFEASVAAAKRLGAGLLMVLSNALGPQGEVLHPLRETGDAEKYRSLVEGLSGLMDRIPESISLVLEPLNTRIDHPGYFLSDLATAFAVVRDVGHPRLRLLCDFYHQAVTGDDPVDVVRKYADFFGHVHIADYPGRHEPGTGRGHWREVLAALADRGYSGFVGFECSPLGGSDKALEAIGRLWTESRIG